MHDHFYSADLILLLCAEAGKDDLTFEAILTRSFGHLRRRSVDLFLLQV